MELSLGTKIRETYQELTWWQKALIYLLAFLLFVVLMDAFVMPFYTRHGKEYPLPPVEGKHVSVAQQVLKENGFIPIVLDSVYDASAPPGTVVRQNPLPHATVKKGRRVYLTVSLGEKPAIVPRLVEKSFKNAELLLRENGLQLGDTDWAYSDTLPHRGVVIYQSIPPGTQVPPGQVINLTISLGPPPTSQELPSFVGKGLESVLKELEILGVRVGRVKARYRPNLAPNTVLRQS
ncbi:MAG: PASTA domain-containing protein, partial [Calditrichaeota bacterium]